jgi:putative oxygen-independent coproporphyrinogen III oxidase
MRSVNWLQPLATETDQEGGFGLYLHWPFCQSKCPYCDFNSHVSASIDQDRWKRAYLSEIKRFAADTKDRRLDTVFFGGGTPSLMDSDLVHAILDEIRQGWRQSNSFEVTLEANPGSVETGRFAGYRDAGVNRVSLGVQALSDDDLRRLGRLHTASEAMIAFETARSVFDRVSFDLIYARQNQSLRNWLVELKQALNMAVDHLSLYQLTIEDGTAFGDRFAQGGLKGLPSDDGAADMYLATQEACDIAGYPAYEISNHARDMCESRHNLIYWRGGDYIGIGPGAHGRLTNAAGRFATETLSSPALWLDKVEKTGSGTLSNELISSADQAVEYLMMSLRLREGSSLARFSAMNGSEVPPESLAWLRDEGFLTQIGDRISATDKGRPVLNAILRELLV